MSKQDLPFVGKHIVFRVTDWENGRKGNPPVKYRSRYRDGRVVFTEVDSLGRPRVIVLPRHPVWNAFDNGARYVPALVEVLRPHRGAHWKGDARAIGIYVNTPIWPVVVASGLLPPSWLAPLATEPHTIARLQEVLARMESIGQACAYTVEERAARELGWRGADGIRLAARGNDDVAEYMREVFKNDAALLEAAELATARERVWYTMGLIMDNALRAARKRGDHKVKEVVPTYNDVAANVSFVASESALRQAYDIESARMCEVLSLLYQKRYAEARALGGPPSKEAR